MERPRRNGVASSQRRNASLFAARTPAASLVVVGGPGKPRGSGFARGGDLRQYQAMGASTPVTPAAAGEQAAVEVLVSFFSQASELPLFSRVYRRQHVDGRFVGAGADPRPGGGVRQPLQGNAGVQGRRAARGGL